MWVYLQLRVERTIGTVSRGIAESGTRLSLPVEGQREFGKLKLVGEVGYQYFRAQENEWVVGLLGFVEASDKLDLMAEVRSSSAKFLNQGDVVINVGLRQTLSTKLRLLASVGTGLTNTPGATSFIAYLGIQLVLGDDRRK